jgi:chromate transporter
MTALSLADATRMWLRIGLLSFGGPAGQIALLHRELVDQRQLLSEKDFLSALNFCMFLPGPEAMQLATYAGWKLHGVRGGLIAGGLFVLPGACVVLALSMLYGQFGNLPFLQAIFWGVKAAVLAIVLEALFKVAKKSLKSASDKILAALSFMALFAFDFPFALVILLAGLFGFFFCAQSSAPTTTPRPSLHHTLKAVCIWMLLWLCPLAALHVVLGGEHVLSDLSRVFSTLAVVTFGGAYAVLTSLGQVVVEQRSWLTTAEMMDGLGLAETTPGPLILVGQFVGYLSAVKQSGSIVIGLGAVAVFLWATFVPCFLWIFAGAPWIDYVQGKPRLSGALQAISAAVVGVILNLTLWFGLHVLFARVDRLDGPIPLWWPDISSFDLPSALLSIALAYALLKLKMGIPKTLVLSAGAGLLWLFVRPFLM